MASTVNLPSIASWIKALNGECDGPSLEDFFRAAYWNLHETVHIGNFAGIGSCHDGKVSLKVRAAGALDVVPKQFDIEVRYEDLFSGGEILHSFWINRSGAISCRGWLRPRPQNPTCFPLYGNPHPLQVEQKSSWKHYLQELDARQVLHREGETGGAVFRALMLLWLSFDRDYPDRIFTLRNPLLDRGELNRRFEAMLRNTHWGD